MLEFTASIRPDDWNLPLFVHIVGAMILVGGLLTGVSALALARGDVRLQRLGYRALLAVALPGYIIMRVGGEWIYDREGWNDDNAPEWIGIGYIVADLGAALLLIGLVTGAFGLRRRRSGDGGGRLLGTTTILAAVFLVACLVAVWAMGGKPS